MKLSISYPTNGTNKTIEIDRKREQFLYGKRIHDTFDGSILGEDFAGYEFQITGGSDLEGFPMCKNLITEKRQRLLLKKGMIGYRCRRDGCRKRKSVRGAIVSPEIAVVCVVLTKVGNSPIEGVTDKMVHVSHWPKRFRKLKMRAGFDPDSDVSIEEVKRKIYEAVLEANDNDIRHIPKIRPTRVNTEKKMQRRLLKKQRSEERRKKTEEERRAFLEKYPEWEKNKNISN